MFLWTVAAWACSFEGQAVFEIDPAVEADPPTPIAVGVAVARGRGPRVGLGTFATSSCDDIGRIELDIQDAGPDQGVRVVAMPDGEWPDGLEPASVEGAWAGDLVFTWIDGARRDQEPFAFVLELTPVSASGEEGAPVEVPVSDAGAPRGCETVAGGLGSGLLAWLAAAATARRRRRLD